MLAPAGFLAISKRRPAMRPAAGGLAMPWRTLLMVIPLAALGVWGLLLGLSPSPARLGTHVQLGLAPCPTLAATGRPCPTCGMTTAAAWLARGRVAEAASANMAALPLFGLVILAAAWAGACAVRGRLVWFENWDRPLELWAVGSFLIAAATWLVRVGQWHG